MNYKDAVHSPVSENANDDLYRPVLIEQMVEVLTIPLIGILLATVILLAELVLVLFKKIDLIAARSFNKS